MTELKFHKGFRVFGEYLSQIDSNIPHVLGIPCRILVPSLTQLLGQNDSFFSVYVAWVGWKASPCSYPLL